MTCPETTTLDALVEAFEAFQRHTRGLRPSTLDGYTVLARHFARGALGEDPIDPRRLVAADVVRYPRAGLTRGALYEVIENGPANRLTVRDDKGEVIEFSPMNSRHLSVYEPDRTGSW